MKNLFLSILAVLIAVSIIRITYGLSSNTLEYSINEFLSAVPDAKSDFQVVVDSVDSWVEDLRNSYASIPSLPADPDLFDYLQLIFDYMTAFFYSLVSIFKIVVAFFSFVGKLLADLVNMILVVFKLLFLPAVDPIVKPEIV